MPDWLRRQVKSGYCGMGLRVDVSVCAGESIKIDMCVCELLKVGSGWFG